MAQSLQVHPRTMRHEVLLLASDKRVQAFDLARSPRVRIGRDESNDLRLASRLVSNFHAEIVQENGALLLRDLGSTNGTYVNDSRVQEALLSNGDRIRVGGHVLSLELRLENDTDRSGPERPSWDGFGPGTRGRLLPSRPRGAECTRTIPMKGGDLAFVDLIELLATTGRSLRVTLDRGTERALVFAHDASVVHAEYAGAVGEKALYRLFSWQGASFEIERLDEPEMIPRTIHLPLEALVAEGLEHALEIGKTLSRLPPLEAPLRLKEDCPLPLTAHSPAEIEIFQAIIRHETIGNVVERSPLTDLRALRLVDSLLQKGVFEVESSGESVMQETYVARPLA